MVDEYKFGDAAKKITFGRVEFFKASGEFFKAFQDMQRVLEGYAKLPNSKAKEIAERNERLQRLSEFYNTSHDLLGMFEDMYERAFKEQPRTIEEDMLYQSLRMMEFAQKACNASMKAGNPERVQIAIDLFLKASDLSLYFQSLGSSDAGMPMNLGEDVGFAFSTARQEWMQEGNVVYRKKVKIVERRNKHGNLDVETVDVPGMITKVVGYEEKGQDGKRDEMVSRIEIEWAE